MNRLLKNAFTFIICLLLLLGLNLPVLASSQDKMIYSSTDTITINQKIPVVDFNASNVSVVESEKDLKYSTNNLKVSYKNNILYITFTLHNAFEDVPISVEAIPLLGTRKDLAKESVVIGQVKNITDGYELTNLRLEESAAEITLMPINLHLAGKSTLSFGIKKNDEIFYFQSELKDLDFNGLIKSAQNNDNKKSEEEKRLLENSYLYMDTMHDEDEFSEVEFTIEDINNLAKTQEDEQVEYLIDYLDKLEGKGEVYSPEAPVTRGIVHNLVPDSIFKSGSFNKWYHKHGGYYCYSYITYRFAGTDNRDSHIAFMEVISNTSKSPFNITVRMFKNVNVLYNVYTKKINLLDPNKNRVRINNLQLQLQSNTKNGIFTSRKYWGVSQKSTLSRVAYAALGEVKYLGTAINLYEALKGEDLNANKKFAFLTTPAKQNAMYGYVIGGLRAKTSQIRYPYDYFSLEGNGSGIKSCSASYKYSAEYK